jgi:hypothetical protein
MDFDKYKVLTKANINEAISAYKDSINEMDKTITSDTVLELLYKLKRMKTGKGPYCGVSLFEAINRIMTDLVILNGIKYILTQNDCPQLKFQEYHVDFGNSNTQEHDIIAEDNDKRLIGEAFNVSESLFNLKKRKSLKKLRNNPGKKDIILLLYNKDATKGKQPPANRNNEYYIPIEV